LELGRRCEVVVELEVELDEEEEDEELEDDEDEGLAVVLELLELLVLLDGAGQYSVSLTICAPAGSSPGGTGTSDAGVVGATLASKLKVRPPRIVTVIVHSSATADGAEANAAATSTPAVATVTLSLLLLTTAA